MAEILGSIFFGLKILATLLSLWFSSRKLYRIAKRRRSKRKPTAQ